MVSLVLGFRPKFCIHLSFLHVCCVALPANPPLIVPVIQLRLCLRSVYRNFNLLLFSMCEFAQNHDTHRRSVKSQCVSKRILCAVGNNSIESIAQTPCTLSNVACLSVPVGTWLSPLHQTSHSLLELFCSFITLLSQTQLWFHSHLALRNEALIFGKKIRRY